MKTTSNGQTSFGLLRNYASRALLGAILLASASACSRMAPSERSVKKELVIAAAADLSPAFEELGKQFETDTGVRVTFSFGSTGILTEQIENGAPVDLFAAANIDFVDRLDREGLVVPDTKALYARGRITIWSRPDSPLTLERVQDLTRPEVKRVAIANPEHAPYGAAARQALQSAGVWTAIEQKLVYGENVRQTMQFAQSGNVDAAIVALSLSVTSTGRWVLIPDDLHKPLDQALAVIRGTHAEKEARQFATFINGPRGRPIMVRYGFVLPGEEPHK